MSDKNSTEREYKNFNSKIKKIAKVEIQRIAEKVTEISKEAEEIGEKIESSLNYEKSKKQN